jgi:hypothetical protein
LLQTLRSHIQHLHNMLSLLDTVLITSTNVLSAPIPAPPKPCLLQYLQNRTDSQLSEILESIRAANYRRFMAINVIYSSLPRAFSSSNVLGMLQVRNSSNSNRSVAAAVHFGCCSLLYVG